MTNHVYIGKQGYRLGAISLLFLSMVFAGCATKQDVLRIDENVRQMRNDQLFLRAKLDRIDSLFADGGQQDNRLRAELRLSLDDLNQQLGQMQNQLNDMQQMVYRLTQRSSDSPQTQSAIIPGTPADTAQPPDTGNAPATSSVDCRRLWDNAFKDMYRGQYDLAISGFSDYVKYCPGSDLTDNSQYWIAEAYYELQQHEQAIAEYNKLLSQYPDSEKRASAIFKLGRTYEKLADTTRALEYFLRLKDEFPGTVEYDQVKDKIDAWQKTNNN